MSLRKNAIYGLSLLLTFSISGLEVKAATGGNTVNNIAVYASYPQRIYIDTPAVNQRYGNENITVSGWALDGSGVKEVNVYLNDKFVGQANRGLARPDVNTAFAGYTGGANSGYSYVIDSSKVDSGSYRIKVEAVGVNGAKINTYKDVVIAKAVSTQNVTYIDHPLSGSSVRSSSVLVDGWALNKSGIKKVNILVDGVLKGEATTGKERLDVDKAFPGYPGGKNSGYTFNLDLNGLDKGKHTITVQAVGLDGSFKNSDTVINVDKLENLLCLDSPLNGSTVNSNTITVSGWTLNNSGTKDIRIIVDGEEKATGTTGIQRLDVDNAFPGYPGGKTSGYSIGVDASKLADGRHTIVVRATGVDGTVKQVVTSISLKKPPVVKPVDPPVVVDPSMKITYKDYANTLDFYVDRQYTGTLNVVWPGGVATKDEIKTYMNPDLYVNDPVAKYIFLKLNYIDGIAVSDLNNALINSGVLTDKGQAFLDGGSKYNVNPIYLVSHAMHETGRGTSTLAKGILVTTVDGKPVMPKVVYNMYGVGAVDSAPDKMGSEYAYKQGWFTVEDAIIGGAQFISKNYINNAVNNQNTLYKMKWDLDRIWHAYATDIGWANKTAPNIKKIIDKMKNPPLQFEVPRFKK